mgnify:CR=1 FL=1
MCPTSIPIFWNISFSFFNRPLEEKAEEKPAVLGWLLLVLLPLFVVRANADYIRWVDFAVPYESMKYALDLDIATSELEKHVSWIEVLALAGSRTGGKCSLASVRLAAEDLKKEKSALELMEQNSKLYNYYYEAYSAVLGGLVGSFAIEKDGKWVSSYGLKAFSPIAAGFGYSHCDDCAEDYFRNSFHMLLLC